MSDIKLFQIDNGIARELEGTSVHLEKALQTLIEKNLETLLGVRFLDSEVSTGKTHRGRIDSLGIDENGCPVILEYKRTTSENVINQGLFYLDWLLDHQADFKWLVADRLGHDVASSIEWSTPRLLCIASDFTRYDEHAVEQINRNIELIRYKRFGDGLLLFELVNATSAVDKIDTEKPSIQSTGSYKTITDVLVSLDGLLADLLDDLKAFVMALGDDVQEKTLKYYLAFRRLKNFACVEVHPNKGCLTVFAKVDPDTVSLEDGFTRDVRNIGHYGTGELEITIRSTGDLERAQPLLERSYEVS